MGMKTAEQVTEGLDLSGLTILVTGGTNGIGKETVRVLAKRGARVFLAARNLTTAEKVKEEILKETPSANIDLLKIDLASLESVRTAAKEFLALNVPLNVLINNAGIFPFQYELSPDGIELCFATNYVGPFLFTHLLLDNLKETAKVSGVEGRIVNVSSRGHEWSYKEGIRFEKLNDKDGFSSLKSYGQSKLAQILYTKELAKRLQEEGASVTVNALHPGAAHTNITHGAGPAFKALLGVFGKLFLLSQQQVAATQVYLAVNPDVTGVTGKYYHGPKEAKVKDKYAFDQDLQKNLWDSTIKMVSV